eukprot:TRINITY_DN26326_c0_g1_i3.p1 TRINITY_DN26326_c0_g1~~TRINITY_DN26326_c0_g1_i3.p1  ORF type:complete len:473 (+),score=31.47 TRINITY_DN26326_c0_g1_i3:45-1463(+)
MTGERDTRGLASVSGQERGEASGLLASTPRVLKGDGSGVLDIDPDMLIRSGSVSLTLSGTATWMEEALSSFNDINVFHVLGRIVYMCFLASLASMLPVLCPFGDPYDLTWKGFARNIGYFLWYGGVGWGFLWTVNTMWAARILNMEMDIGGTIVIPTIFAVSLFAAAYIVLGGPAPLGTVSCGTFCFLVEWLCLWNFMLKRHPCGLRLLAIYVAWFALLGIYFMLTLLLKRAPLLKDSVAAIYPFLGEMVSGADFVELIFGNAVRDCHQDQLNAAVLFKLMFVGLHTTYSNFLFPVLGDVRSVVTSAIIGFALTIGKEFEQTVTLDDAQWRGKRASDAYAKSILNKSYITAMKCVSPVLFGCLLAFDLYGFNKGMLYTFNNLSPEQLQTCVIGIAINFCVALASMFLSICRFRRWLALNPAGGATILGDDGVRLDLARFTVVRTLDIAKQLTIDRLFDFFALLWMTWASVWQ